MVLRARPGGDRARPDAYLRHYYAFLGPMADMIAGSIPTTPEAVKGAIAAYGGVGVEEIVFWPCAPELEQVDRLADSSADGSSGRRRSRRRVGPRRMTRRTDAQGGRSPMSVSPTDAEPPIHPETRIGHVHLKVADLERPIAFYRDALRLRGDGALRRPGRLPVGRRLPPPHRAEHLGEPGRARRRRRARPASTTSPSSTPTGGSWRAR